MRNNIATATKLVRGPATISGGWERPTEHQGILDEFDNELNRTVYDMRIALL